METIYIDYGLYTRFTVDLSEVDFNGVEKLILTAKRYVNGGKELYTVFVREYITADTYVEVVTPKESELFDGTILYDFIAVMSNGEVYKASEVGKMILRKGVGKIG